MTLSFCRRFQLSSPVVEDFEIISHRALVGNIGGNEEPWRLFINTFGEVDEFSQ
jgi:hypothetical protein